MAGIYLLGDAFLSSFAPLGIGGGALALIAYGYMKRKPGFANAGLAVAGATLAKNYGIGSALQGLAGKLGVVKTSASAPGLGTPGGDVALANAALAGLGLGSVPGSTPAATSAYANMTAGTPIPGQPGLVSDGNGGITTASSAITNL